MPRISIVPCIAAVVALTAAVATTAHAQLRPPIADVTPLLATEAVPAGGNLRGALRVTLPEGLHANSNRPRDPLLIPMQLSFDPPEGVTVDEVVWPEATDFEQEGASEPLAVFEREFVVGVSLRIAEDVESGELVVPVSLRYQACNDVMCFMPATVDAEWSAMVAPAGTAVVASHADVFDLIPFGTGEAPGADVLAERPRIVDLANTPEGVSSALAVLDQSFTVAGMTNYVGTADFVQFIHNAEAGVVEQGMFDGHGPLAILLIVLIGGLALNLTPCVLPMIPINLAIIGAGAQAGSRTRGLLLGATYGSAMAIVYGLLGLVVVLTAGTFGTINASPWFNLGIAALFVVLALAMFDVLAIDLSRFASNLHVGETGSGTFMVAFGMGAVAALLAGACVAPVVIQVVLLSSDLYASGTTVALALPFFLGLGMAIPWPIAGAGIAALPKPGAWMVRVKQAFGVFILATAVYYGYTAYGLFANRWVDPMEVVAGVEEKIKEGWYASLPAGVDEAAREGKPVLIDFWATWCKNCLIMDSTTMRDPEVVAALDDYVKIKFQAEDASESPAKEALDYFRAIGLPTYVILKPSPSTGSFQ